MRSFALISVLASVAFTQATSIPSGINAACSTFLTTLDSNADLLTCTKSLTTSTSSFGPGGSGTSSSAAVSSALSNLCSSTSSCSETSIRTTLASFYSACQPELTSSLNQQVLEIYDVLYTLIPLKEAACTKDDSGKWCASEITGSAPSASSLYSGTEQTAITPNFDTLKSSNAAFLFLTPSLSQDKLCTTCARNVITSYISFESDIQYAPGLSNSLLLNGQTALYQAVTSTCGSSFLSGAVQAAGSLSDGVISSNGASRSTGSAAGAIAALLGVVSVAMAL